MDAGILGYGVYLPKYRLKVEEVASVWGKNVDDIKKSLYVSEKSVAALDEDAVTIAYEAANSALKRAQITADQLEVCLVGSESHPYAVNPTSTIVAEFLGVGHNYLATDLEFACKAATTGLIVIAGLIGAKKIKRGIVIGSDCAQAKPHDVLEYTAASAGAAFILGDKKEAIAELIDFSSYSSDTPDFWRRDGVRFPSHGGRFTGEPSYFTHVEAASQMLFAKLRLKPADFSYCIFHMPNGKFPRIVAKRLGFSDKQLAPSLTVSEIGNPYSASSLLGLANVLDIAKPRELIFVASYGSGAGSDSFVFETTTAIKKKEYNIPTFSDFAKHKKYISYIDYLRFRKKI